MSLKIKPPLPIITLPPPPSRVARVRLMFRQRTGLIRRLMSHPCCGPKNGSNPDFVINIVVVLFGLHADALVRMSAERTF